MKLFVTGENGGSGVNVGEMNVNEVSGNEIKSVATYDSIAVYWRKPLEMVEKYDVFLDGALSGETDKTHYEFRGLRPETTYTITIRAVWRNDADAERESGPWQGIGATSGSGDVGILSGVQTFGELCVTTKKAGRRLDVTQAPYCAAGDGKTMDTAAIQKALDDCGVGETVYLPPGTYRTGALRLHSDMELYLEEGATLQGTDNPEDYLPRVWSRFEGIEQECYSSYLNLGQLDHEAGCNCRNVTIRGGGTIASGGRSLAEKVIASEKERLKDYLASLGDKLSNYEKPETIPGRVRPRLIHMANCQNIYLSGVTFKDGASWNLQMIYSDDIVTEGCTFYSTNVWNGDGWDPDSSTNCTIFGCMFYTGDDAVAIKSGKNPEGNEIARPTEHVWIFDCKSAFGHGITIGSEMSGGINDVQIWDCDMGSSMCGIEIKGTKKRGGYVRNVHVRNCSAARVLFHSVGYNDDGIGAPKPPVFENCSFEGMQILGEYFSHDSEWVPCEAIELVGFDAPGHELKNILFKDITIGSSRMSRRQSISLQYCENITLERVKCL